nr:MAG: putative glycoprotein 2 [Jingmen shrew arterivirus 1]
MGEQFRRLSRCCAVGFRFLLCTVVVCGIFGSAPSHGDNAGGSDGGHPVNQICINYTASFSPVTVNVTVNVTSSDRLSAALSYPLARHFLQVTSSSSRHDELYNLESLAKLVAILASRLSIYPEFLGPNSTFTGVDVNQSMLCWTGRAIPNAVEAGEEYVLKFHLFPPFWVTLKPFYCSVLALGFARAMRGVFRVH